MSDNQKGGLLEGGSATAEALASSESVFNRNYGSGTTKGLQQYYTPQEPARLVHAVIGSGVCVLDPTAGDGSLLRWFANDRRFGVELDKDQLTNATEAGRPYQGIRGDIQHVYPLLRRVGPEWNAIVANPPFGLQWSDPTYKDGEGVNSALLTLVYINRLLSELGQYVFIAGRDRFLKHIIDKPEARGIYAVVECPIKFKDAELPSVMAFGVKPTNRKVDVETLRISSTPEEVATAWSAIARQITAHREVAAGYVRTYDGEQWGLRDLLPAIQREYNRRTDERVQTREFDIDLVGGSQLNVQLSAFAALALKHQRAEIATLHNQSAMYFAQNERLWRQLVELAADGVLRVAPKVEAFVGAYLEEAKRELVPLYPLKPQQRLGFLDDLDYIRCTKDDLERGFAAGERYPIYTRTQTIETQEERAVQIKSGKNAGSTEIAKFTKTRKALRITIGKESFLDDERTGSNDIAYIIEHFEVPDPGDVSSRFPELYEAMKGVVDRIDSVFVGPCSAEWAAHHPEDGEARMRRFQREDLARLLTKGSGVLAWEQGLGKTLGGGAFAQGCIDAYDAEDKALFIVPQDLIPQWKRDIQRFFGRTLEVIASHDDALRVRRHLRAGGTGWYVTYYEAISTNATQQSQLLPTVRMNERTSTVHDPETGEAQVVHEFVTSEEFCPQCGADARSGWNGQTCRGRIAGGLDRQGLWLQERDGEKRMVSKTWKGDVDDRGCGYAHFRRRVKPMASLLTTTFRHGVIVVDEGTMVKGDTAKRALAVRGLRATHKLLMSGTPVKNFIPDAFWLLWWALGDGSRRFPYRYEGGKTKFENDFAVIEHKRDKKTHQKQNRKVLPEVTNLSMLWRLLCSSIVRRLQEESGEPLVSMRFHPIEVPLGAAQSRMQKAWAEHFETFFTEMNPDHNLVKYGLVGIWAPMIGLQPKLEYAAILPESDPHKEWLVEKVNGLLREGDAPLELSNWTPANLKVLELTMGLVKQGRKVLIGSSRKSVSSWLAEQLTKKNVRAMHLLNGAGDTASPAKRAELVQKFQRGDAQVLCSGIKALRLGHNLDAGSAVIVHGLEWDHESFQQFIKRVHRLTSTKSIDCYVVLPKGTLTVEKWGILGQKADAAALALDGRLTEKDEDPVDEASVVREFIERGLNVEHVVDEADVYRHWRSKVPSIGLFRPWPELLGETGSDHPSVDAVNGGWTPKAPAEPSDVEDIVVELPSIGRVSVPAEVPDEFFDTSGNGLLFVEATNDEAGDNEWMTLFDLEEAAA